MLFRSYATKTIDPILHGRSVSEVEWIKEVEKHSENHYVVIPWKVKNPVGYKMLKELTVDKEVIF